jgi:hypothetical protein
VFEEFQETCQLLRQLELSDQMRIVTQKHPETGYIGFFMIFDSNGEGNDAIDRVLELLELDPGTTKAQLIPYHGKEHGPNEIVVDTRSPLSILYFLSQSVQVPASDEGWGKVTVTLDEQGAPFDWNQVLGGVMSIKFSKQRNGFCPSIATCYRGSYFYIDDSDLNSKSTFQMLTQLLALQTSCPQLPVYTLPLRD